jgi:hypothetical protein
MRIGRTDLADVLDFTAGHPDHDSGPRFTYFSLTEPAGARAFYSYLVHCLDNAREAIYRTGHGFHHERGARYYDGVIRAEERALDRGVEIVRIQTGTHVAAGWANGYARLLQRFEGRFRIKAGFDNAPFSDIGLTDPHGYEPIIYLLIETRLPSSSGIVTRPAGAVFIERNQHLAAELGRQFVARADGLRDLSWQDVRDLSRTYTYFAWGVHMASQRMHVDVPDARLRGTAVLRGWRRNITAMLAGPADRSSITRTGRDDDLFDGVAYELSWWAKQKLDSIEGRSYQPVEVTVTIDGVDTEAFTYLPLPPSTRDRDLSRNSWIGLVIEGARENNVSQLVEELRSAGYSV